MKHKTLQPSKLRAIPSLHCEEVLIHRDTIKEIVEAYDSFEDCPQFLSVVAWPKGGDNGLASKKHDKM